MSPNRNIHLLTPTKVKTGSVAVFIFLLGNHKKIKNVYLFGKFRIILLSKITRENYFFLENKKNPPVSQPREFSEIILIIFTTGSEHTTLA